MTTPPAKDGQGVSGEPNVLFVATSGGEGGIERYSVRLAARLRARGVPVLYACRPRGFLQSLCASQGIPTVDWNVRNSGDARASFSLAQLLRAHAIDIVHVHSRRDYVPAILGTSLARPRPRLLLHAHLIRRLGEPAGLAGTFFRWGAAGVLAVSEAVRERLEREHHLPPEFVHLLPNGVETEVFVTADSAEGQARRVTQRQAWGVPSGAVVLGMMGRLNAKGQAALLAAAPALLVEHPETWIVLAGPDGADGDRERLREQARRAGIAERVIVPGITEDVPAAMAAFDVLVHLPSDESFGLALVEAMAAGLPTIATDIGGCREVVQDGITGILVPEGDAKALQAALRRLLDPHGGPSLRAELGRAGRRRALQDFSLERQVERLHALYRRLTLERSRIPPPGPLPGVRGNSRFQRYVRPVAAALMVAVVALVAFALRPHHRVAHNHVPQTHRASHARLGARPNSHVSRGRGPASTTPI